MSRSRPDVIAIIQPFVPTYRVPFFDALSTELTREGLKLEVWHDEPKGRVAARGNAARGSWSVPIRQRRFSVFGKNITFRRVHRKAREVALVVAGLASGNLETYWLARDRRVRLALWGHGRNFTAAHNSVDARLERWLIRRSLRVFVYTPAGARYLLESGVSEDSVTVVMNSTDTRAVAEARQSVSEGVIRGAREKWRVEGSRVAVFIGAFDDAKRLPFLFEAADEMFRLDPSFELALAGAGPMQDWVEGQAGLRTYVRLLGRVDSDDLGVLSHLAKVILMPGRVGLVAADALAMGVPIVTTRHNLHAPEAEYLDSTVSLWTEVNAEMFAREALRLMTDEDSLLAMRHASTERSAELSAEAAAARFASGILSALRDG